ncbi:MAG TPA: ParB/RepB/Spo0J family partition protein [Rhizomicrobium sp.]
MTDSKRTDARKSEDGRHRALGRGLSALIGDEAPTGHTGAAPDPGGRNPRTLPVAFLRPNPFQPRQHFDGRELDELALSIREKGLLQPILVRPVAGASDAYEIVAGERRWRAAQLAKLHDVPVVIRELGDAEALEFAIIENVQRSDLNAVEEGAAYRQLMDRFGYTQERLAEEIGKSRSHVANTLRLIRLPEAVQAMIREGKLSAGHARTLIGAANPEALARQIVKREFNVRQAEQRSPVKPGRTSPKAAKDADTKAIESSLSNMLGLNVQILHRSSAGGELRIVYRTLEQLDDLIQRLHSKR